ncbi:MAG: hypothetical protein ABH823_01820 [bacterium]
MVQVKNVCRAGAVGTLGQAVDLGRLIGRLQQLSSAPSGYSFRLRLLDGQTYFYLDELSEPDALSAKFVELKIRPAQVDAIVDRATKIRKDQSLCGLFNLDGLLAGLNGHAGPLPEWFGVDVFDRQRVNLQAQSGPMVPVQIESSDALSDGDRSIRAHMLRKVEAEPLGTGNKARRRRLLEKLALFDYKMELFESAEELFGMLERENNTRQGEFRARRWRLKSVFKQGRFAEALEAFIDFEHESQRVGLSHEARMAVKWIGRCQYELGEYEDALETLRAYRAWSVSDQDNRGIREADIEIAECLGKLELES